MVDIHTHILHGLDDGAHELEESVAMLRIAAESGTTDIVATPHASPDYVFRPETIEARIAELRRAGGDTPRIHRGCDFHFTPENIGDAIAFPDKYSINGRGYLLVEFADFFVPRNAADLLGRLSVAGMRPVITHPERNQLLQRRFELLAQWVEQGCLMQITALSLVGGFGREAQRSCREMLKRGLVHFVASDAHDCRHRTPALDRAWDHLSRKFGREHAEILLETNPAAALTGAPAIALPEPRRKWLWF